ncbi:MAG: hypothetical protein AB7O62_22915 [Pirellulales bacterium]
MSRSKRAMRPPIARLAGLAIDTHLFRRQRAMLARLLCRGRNTPSITLTAGDREMLSGLENLCDAIADHLDNLPVRPRAAARPRARRRK